MVTGRCEIGCRLVLFTNKVSNVLLIGIYVSDLEWRNDRRRALSLQWSQVAELLIRLGTVAGRMSGECYTQFRTDSGKVWKIFWKFSRP